MRSGKTIPALLLLALMRSTSLAESLSLIPSKDNTIFQDSGTLSNGKGIYVFTGLINNNFRRRGLVAFDLSSIPANATVTAAGFSLKKKCTRNL